MITFISPFSALVVFFLYIKLKLLFFKVNQSSFLTPEIHVHHLVINVCTVQLDGNLVHECGCVSRNAWVARWAPSKLVAVTHMRRQATLYS